MNNTTLRSRRAFIGAAGAGLMGAAVASAAPADNSLVSAVDDRADLELIRRMVQIPSFSREETPLAKFLVEQMKALGLDAQLQELVKR